MPRLLDPLWLILVTLGERKLAQTVEYLREENRILRSKLPDRIVVTARERARLVRFGRRLGTAISGVITIVSPRTFARWAAGGTPRRRSGRTPGRPRTAAAIRDLVLRLARETGWGYARILGELKKLGAGPVSRSTVINILRTAGLNPGRSGAWARGPTSSSGTRPPSGPATSSP